MILMGCNSDREILKLDLLPNHLYDDSLEILSEEGSIKFVFNQNNILAGVQVVGVSKLLPEFKETFLENYDPTDLDFLNFSMENDSCYIKLPGSASSFSKLETKILENKAHLLHINVDVNEKGQIYGIEILDASSILPGYIVEILKNKNRNNF